MAELLAAEFPEFSAALGSSVDGIGISLGSYFTPSYIIPSAAYKFN